MAHVIEESGGGRHHDHSNLVPHWLENSSADVPHGEMADMEVGNMRRGELGGLKHNLEYNYGTDREGILARILRYARRSY